MYFPYLRGKRYELLALRELSQEFQSRNTGTGIHPIIEPVRDPRTSVDLNRALSELSASPMGFTLVINPQVGDLSKAEGSFDAIVESLEQYEVLPSGLELGIALSENTMLDAAHAVQNSSLNHLAVNYIFRPANPDIGDMEELNSIASASRYVASGKDVVRIYDEVLNTTRPTIKLSDPFPKQASNLDYVAMNESVFGNSHRFFDDDGYAGFGDYCTIGNHYAEGGATPYAVVIHLTYPSEDRRRVMIRHFASDENLDQSDTARKFGEAVKKLVEFADLINLDNPAIQSFRTYDENGHFPGLGMLKKLSVLNHIYVMNDLLGNVEGL